MLPFVSSWGVNFKIPQRVLPFLILCLCTLCYTSVDICKQLEILHVLVCVFGLHANR